MNKKFFFQHFILIFAVLPKKMVEAILSETGEPHRKNLTQYI
jgi:hypothetical protein